MRPRAPIGSLPPGAGHDALWWSWPTSCWDRRVEVPLFELHEGVVLVPVDFSEASMTTLQRARGMVDRPERVHVVTVLVPAGTLPGGLSDGEAREAHVREELVRACGAECTHHVRFGDPGAEIARLADEIDANLIVIAARGRGGAPVPLGSTAERVVRLATRPVFLARDA